MAFKDIKLPYRICEEFSGAPVFNTDIVRSRANYVQANVTNDDAVWKWTSSNFLANDAKRLALIGFVLALRGMGHTFRFRDMLHYWHGMEWQGAQPVYLPVASVYPFATGDGVKTAFQLTIPYVVTDTEIYYRKITKPGKPEPVGPDNVFAYEGPRIYIGTTLQTSGVTVNYSTGIITFASAPPNGAAIRFAGFFDCHARFSEDAPEISLGDGPEVASVTFEIMEELNP